MYDFKKTIEGTDIHTAGLQKELIKHYAHPTDIDLDTVYFICDIEFECHIEMRRWGVKDFTLYTTNIGLIISVNDDNHKSKEWEVDLKDWKIVDEHLTEGVVGKSPDSVYFDFNTKIVIIYYQQ